MSKNINHDKHKIDTGGKTPLEKQEVGIPHGIRKPSGVLIEKRLYSIKEASLYLGRTVCAVREMIWAGKMPQVKDGRRVLLDKLDMDIWIDSRKVVNQF